MAPNSRNTGDSTETDGRDGTENGFPEPEMTEESVTPEAWGKFLCTVFDEWVSHDIGNTGVQFFMETLSLLSGRPSSLCMLQKTCGRVLVVEHDGSVYSCDHYVDRRHCLGNIHERPLSEMADSAFQEKFGNAKEESLAERCRNCPYLALCRGNCPKDRFNRDGSYYLCDGLRMFYDHAVPMLRNVLEMNRKKTPVGTIMAAMRSEIKKQNLTRRR